MPEKKKNAAAIAAEEREKARKELAGKPLEGEELNVVKEIAVTEAICGKEGCGAKSKIQVLQGNSDKMKFQAVRMACAKEAAEEEAACDWVSVPFEAAGLYCNQCCKSTLHGMPGGFFQGAYVCLVCKLETPKDIMEYDPDKVAVVVPKAEEKTT